MHGYAEMYRVPPEQLAQFEQQFHQIAEAPGPARPGARRGGRGQRPPGHRGASWTQRIGELAEARDVPAGELYGTLQKANRLPELERAITEEKAFAFLLQQSTIDEAKS